MNTDQTPGAPGRHFRLTPILVGFAAIAMGAVALFAGSPERDAAAADCQGSFTIDFAGLPHGTILGEQYAAQGVHISAVGNDAPGHNAPDALIVFDTNRPPTHDPDLAIDIGNIALMALNTTDETGPDGSGPPDGLVDDPDENNIGGIATFAFDQDVHIGSIKWIDKDAVADNFVIAYNANGDVITSVPVPLGANSQVQTIPINADGVRRLVFDYDESGGITGIEVTCQDPGSLATPTPAAGTGATPTPAAGGATPTQAAAVAAAVQAPAQDPARLPAQAPSTGGSPHSGGAINLAAISLLALGLGLSVTGAFAAQQTKRRD